jgi:hypothetical protein
MYNDRSFETGFESSFLPNELFIVIFICRESLLSHFPFFLFFFEGSSSFLNRSCICALILQVESNWKLEIGLYSSALMICGTQPNKLWKMPSMNLEDLGNSTLEMELSMDPRSTLRLKTPLTDITSAELYKPISNFQLDSTCNIKAQMQLLFKKELLPSKKNKKKGK